VGSACQKHIGRIHCAEFARWKEAACALGSLLTSISVLSLDGNGGNELAGGEVIEGAEAAAKFGVAQAAVAVERAYKFHGVALGLQLVAIQTARDEVAVGIAAEVCLRDDVVEAPSLEDEPAQTIETAAALAGVHGAAERLGLEEIGLREAGVG